jgi:spermidine/putrescine transport system ATP-binding protein
MQLELKSIQRDLGITFVYVTHDQEEALTMSDRVAVMNEGRVEQLGSPQEIYDTPASVFVAGFIGLANILPATVESADADTVTVRFPEGGGMTGRRNGREFRAGDPATVVLRPERMRITSAAPDGAAGRINARVRAMVFQGAVTRVDLDTHGGGELNVILLSQERPLEIGEAESVWVSWDPDGATVLPGATEAAAAVDLPDLR